MKLITSLLFTVGILSAYAQDGPLTETPAPGDKGPLGEVILDAPDLGPGIDALKPKLRTGAGLYESVVRIENTSVEPDYKNPWNAGRQSGGSGTGFLVGHNMFLTNAHVVSNSFRTLIKKYGDPTQYSAKIVYIAHDCDLALLELEDPIEFDAHFGEVTPLKIGEIPELETTVTAIGYPVGGKRISTTRGVISRIDFQPYSHSGVDYHLTIQIDAAINPGNSGGPVVQDGKVVGVAFQGYSGNTAQNVSYMIPPPVIRRFLKDIEDGTYDRYVDLAVSELALLNPAMRAALGLTMNSKGVMVANVTSGGSADEFLNEGDVLLEIDGYVIAADGFVNIEGELVNMNEIVERKFAGDTIKLKVIRDGETIEIDVLLKAFTPYLITANQYDKKPEYVMFAGLVFQPLDRNLLAAHKITDMRVRYNFNYYAEEEIYKEKPQVVILTTVLPDEINTHLKAFTHNVIEKINGEKISDMQDAYDALNPEEIPEFFVIELAENARPIVIEGALAEAAQNRIMKTYQVSKDHYIEEPKLPELKEDAVD